MESFWGSTLMFLKYPIQTSESHSKVVSASYTHHRIIITIHEYLIGGT
nr:MAG TPA: hypothetical protein [Caudoviricetes sp.]